MGGTKNAVNKYCCANAVCSYILDQSNYEVNLVTPTGAMTRLMIRVVPQEVAESDFLTTVLEKGNNVSNM